MQLSLAVLVACQAAVIAASSLTPPVLPLIVRNPYLSTWFGNAREAPWEKWPMFYTGEEVGLSLMAQVPSQGAVYPLLGKPQESLSLKERYELWMGFTLHKYLTHLSYNIEYPKYLGHNYDASTTNLTYHIDTGSADPIDITVSFLSPITPSSTLRQSIPASYVTIDVQGDVEVNIYMDVDGRWVSGDPYSKIEWGWDKLKAQHKNSDSDLQRWQIQRETELLLTETRDSAEWGTLHFTGPAVSLLIKSIVEDVC